MIWRTARVFCVVVAVLASGCESKQSGKISGPLTVKYTISTLPGQSSGGTIEDVASLEFRDGMVVVVLKNGSGNVFSAARLQHLSWTRPQQR